MSTTPEDPFQSKPEDAAAAQTPPPQQTPPPSAQQPGQQYAQPPYQQQPPQYAQPSYSQPQYAQPYSPMQPYGQPSGPRPGTAKNWLGITSLILGLLGLFTGITAIAGIVFGHLGRAAARRGEADNAGMSLAGLIISYVITILGILGIIAMFVFFGWIATECGGDNPASWCDPETSYTWDATA